MPIYEFKCRKCSHKFEEIVQINKKEKISCPSCGSKEITKCVSSFGISGINKNLSPSSGSCPSCSSDSCNTCS